MTDSRRAGMLYLTHQCFIASHRNGTRGRYLAHVFFLLHGYFHPQSASGISYQGCTVKLPLFFFFFKEIVLLHVIISPTFTKGLFRFDFLTLILFHNCGTHLDVSSQIYKARHKGAQLQSLANFLHPLAIATGSERASQVAQWQRIYL